MKHSSARICRGSGAGVLGCKKGMSKKLKPLQIWLLVAVGMEP